jgi:hypothetical protein
MKYTRIKFYGVILSLSECALPLIEVVRWDLGIMSADEN